MSAMDKIRMGIYGLQYSQTQTGAYALILEETEGNRRLPIIIGSAEAQSIAIVLEEMTPTRPLTHDIFKSVTVHFGLDMVEVVINKLEDGVFFSKAIFTDSNRTFETDCRPSDAIALAIRFNCPIYASDFILNSAAFEKEGDSGIKVIPPTTDDAPMSESIYTAMTPEELQEMLEDALDKEDYELASKIRDELKRRG